ncbi:alanine--tRNA ligase, mitochondrial-like [Scyliorhinus canicula]|uniref:alanine--tRNA ligase, mitochondrial-like n=1 Tax=Scyliorhinus canicula TaxID=7830 RepID=UPI0018F778A0|nr:alanine--tRNA ligase, mitochondrial-like [Scyliorhinus canicula]
MSPSGEDQGHHLRVGACLPESVQAIHVYSKTSSKATTDRTEGLHESHWGRRKQPGTECSDEWKMESFNMSLFFSNTMFSDVTKKQHVDQNREITVNGAVEGRGATPVDVAWSLHRNLGFPLDLIGLMLEEKAVAMDTEALVQLAKEEAERLRRSTQSDTQPKAGLGLHAINKLQRIGVPRTDDSAKYAYTIQDGKYAFPRCQATVLALFQDHSFVQEVGDGQRCAVILDRTNFYCEQGGQCHDQGYCIREEHQDVLLPVEDVQTAGGFAIHTVCVPESLHVGDRLNLFVDEAHRLACMVKHTATHLLNFALRTVLGDYTEQRGSHITADRLRFDYSIKVGITVAVTDWEMLCWIPRHHERWDRILPDENLMGSVQIQSVHILVYRKEEPATWATGFFQYECSGQHMTKSTKAAI